MHLLLCLWLRLWLHLWLHLWLRLSQHLSQWPSLWLLGPLSLISHRIYFLISCQRENASFAGKCRQPLWKQPPVLLYTDPYAYCTNDASIAVPFLANLSHHFQKHLRINRRREILVHITVLLLTLLVVQDICSPLHRYRLTTSPVPYYIGRRTCLKVYRMHSNLTAALLGRIVN